MREYLGDSVYAEFDGFAINLYLDNGAGPFNTISLDHETLDALDRFRQRVKEEINNQQAKEPTN